MRSSHTKQQPHIVCVPFPAQGHINPFMQLAKILHYHGFHITFVNTESNQRRLVRSLGPTFVKSQQGFQFETIPDVLSSWDIDANPDVSALCDSTRKNCFAPFKELLIKLNTSLGAPPVSFIISDGVMSFAIKAAKELSIPEAQFWTASACGFMGYLQFSELVNRGIIPFKDNESITDSALDMPVDWIPGMKNIRLKDLPSFIRTTNLDETMFDFMGSEVRNCLTSSNIIFNTFQDFELQVLDAIKAKFPSIYNTGPLSLLGRHVPEDQFLSFGSSLWIEDSKCLKWLDKWQPNSVVYVNYGSWTVITEHHLKELAWGLANSKYPFLWIIRADVLMGESAILPKEFSDEIEERGYITSWCPQDRVLSDPSIGLFLTHCGWNSLTEAICGGVPVICWPFFAEQQMNCRYVCTTWSIGMEVNHDVKRGEIAELVKEMIEGEKGKEMKQNVLEWREKALQATDIGGSSYNDFNRLIEEALHFEE
ncbi:linamarin synthase 2-like [Abrus precatorius]|uniref:Glycosyltransferase n=1 Tax=Abrus precatorius TaxID=3816 RepID=A0A8B8K3Z0_ABRPR|nr:linamarin synthase 2-like [Abrus precatorius]